MELALEPGSLALESAPVISILSWRWRSLGEGSLTELDNKDLELTFNIDVYSWHREKKNQFLHLVIYASSMEGCFSCHKKLIDYSREDIR